MRAPPSTTDIVALIGSEMMTWPTTVATDERQSRACFTALADRVIDYFPLHYMAGHNSTGVLPGLPSTKRTHE